MEWLNDMNENMEVDIGYVSRMELISSMPSIKSLMKDTDSNGNLIERSVSDSTLKPISPKSYENLIKQIKWDQEIEINEAYSLLEKSFYPFKQVTYHAFLDAFKKAQRLNKLVHYILLWGALDDQSC